MDTPTAGIGALITATVAAIGAIFHQNQRISVLEAQREGDDKKLDHIQSQVDKLVDWAMDQKS